MSHRTGFFAYPSIPTFLGDCIRAGISEFWTSSGNHGLSGWEETDVAGYFIRTRIIQGIEESDYFLADVTYLNFNVTYEIGYAIGLGKPILLTRNVSIAEATPTAKEVGIFDTLGSEGYENSQQLQTILTKTETVDPIVLLPASLNRKSPVYLIEPKYKTDPAIRIIARLNKKGRLDYRSFDPNEQPRLSGSDAIMQVAQSFGVLVHLLSSPEIHADIHNIRAAFIAGLANGMRKETVILQHGDEPVPMDYRDLVDVFYHPEQVDEFIADFATRVTAAFQAAEEPRIKRVSTFLEQVSLGASSAENELRDLAAYYLETDAFQRAFRGDARIVVGRKGSGKSAIFHRVGDKVRANQGNIVLDLKPEGYKLLKFKEDVFRLMSEGTLEHTITAFWEYLLLLEICYKILEKDRVQHVRDQRLYEPYQKLAALYQSDAYVGEGDFSERMTGLLQHVSQEAQRRLPDGGERVRLSTPEVTELLYVHDVHALRKNVIEYLDLKKSLWLLIDNLDKGWPTHGVEGEDLVIIRALLEATRKIERQLRRDNFECRTLVFLRNDIYEILIGETSDRGKESKVVLDWSDEDMLRELLRRRFVYNEAVPDDASFDEVWRIIAVSHIDGEESSQFVVERSLMRPRALLDLVGHCRSVAINLGHTKIERDDFTKGLSTFSSDLLSEINLEIRDVLPAAEDVLYQFIGSNSRLGVDELNRVVDDVSESEAEREAFIELLLWYGALGVMRPNGDATFIYSVNYDMKRLKAIISKLVSDGLVYVINPAFGAALEVDG